MRVVTVAHGTRHAAGNRIAAELTQRVGERLGLDAQVSYVELCAPLFADVVAASDEPTIAVPLLLSRGYHVAVDLPAALLGAAGEITLAPALGPHPLLARAQAARLIEAGAVPGKPVVMIAAGSRDVRASDDLGIAADLLSTVWGAPARVAVLSGDGSRPADLIQPGDAASLYLLAPGHFADRAAQEARSAGAHPVADVIGAHDLLVDLIAERVAPRMWAGPPSRSPTVAIMDPGPARMPRGYEDSSGFTNAAVRRTFATERIAARSGQSCWSPAWADLERAG